MDRRNFLKTATVAAAGSVAPAGAQDASSSVAAHRPESPNMIYRELGRTGERVSAIGLGGYHIGKQQDPDESIRLLRTAIDRGITFMDNCWDYNGGISEVRMGQALRDGYRQKVFLMTKIDGRDKNTAARQIEQSLGRLQSDVIDSFNSMRSFASTIQMLSSPPAGTWRQFRKPNKRAKSATSASQVTRIPAYICACLRLPTSTGFTSTLCRCRSM
jgi:hypothetical protein